MKELTCYQHEATKKIFKTKKEYNTFESKYLEAKKKEREEKEINDDWEKIINEPRLTATSIEDFRLKIIELFNKINGPYGYTIKNLLFNYKNLEEVSNSHSAPIGYRTNWGGNSDKEGIPRSYIGWAGQLTGELDRTSPLKKYNSGSISIYELVKSNQSSAKIPGLNTGSGGGGNFTFRYELSLFLYDFPLIMKKYQPALESKIELDKKLPDYNDWNKRLDNELENRKLSDSLIDLYTTANKNLDYKLLKYKEKISLEKSKNDQAIYNRIEDLREIIKQKINYPEELRMEIEQLKIKSDTTKIN